jgi:hypothetical protein
VANRKGNTSITMPTIAIATMPRFTAGCLGIIPPGSIMVGIMELARRILGCRRIFRPVKVGRYSMFTAGKKILEVEIRI